MTSTIFRVWDRNSRSFIPERRTRSAPPPAADQRRKTTWIVSEAQYARLLADLDRIRDTKAQVGKGARWVRHAAVVLGVSYLALSTVSAPVEPIQLSMVGAGVQVSLGQLALAIPVLAGYLILHATSLSARKIRFDHEERIIESYLDRFGCPTAATLTRTLASHCRRDEGSTAPIFYRWSKQGVETFIALVVLASVSRAVLTLHQQGSIDSFFGGITVAILAVIILTPPIALAASRRTKGKALNTLVTDPERFDKLCEAMCGR